MRRLISARSIQKPTTSWLNTVFRVGGTENSRCSRIALFESECPQDKLSRSHGQRTDRPKRRVLKNNFGQVALEYVLLLGVGVTIWLFMANQLISRSPTNQGIIIKKWVEVINFIGADKID
jgi:hypothetical protein